MRDRAARVREVSIGSGDSRNLRRVFFFFAASLHISSRFFAPTRAPHHPRDMATALRAPTRRAAASSPAGVAVAHLVAAASDARRSGAGALAQELAVAGLRVSARVVFVIMTR